MANIEQAQQMIPLITFPLVKMSASWFLVSMYLIWIVGQDSFDQTTNQVQLCESWKRVSLWDFFF